MKYSLTQGGILAAVLIPVIVSLGFSDSCSNEIVSQSLPFLSSLPGAVMAWIGRYRMGDVTLAGFKK